MIPLELFYKDPDEVLDYVGDWSAWLGTDTIATASWDVPEGITDDSTSTTATTTTIWLSGGTAGAVYDVSCCASTAGGRVGCRTIRVSVVER